MRVRITGTQQKCIDAVRVLRLGFAVREVSTFGPNRGDSTLGRVYLEVDAPVPATPFNDRSASSGR